MVRFRAADRDFAGARVDRGVMVTGPGPRDMDESSRGVRNGGPVVVELPGENTRLSPIGWREVLKNQVM